MFCSNCGTKLAEGSKFCSGCGIKVGETGISTEKTADNDNRALSVVAINYFKKGQEYFAQDDYNNAVLAYGKAIKQEPNFTEAYQERARSFFCINQFSKAIKDLDKAINNDPNNPVLYYLRGLAYYSLDNEEVPEDDNNSKAMRMMLGDFSDDDEEDDIVEDNIEQAIMDFSAAIEIDNEYIDAYLERAKIYEEQKEYNSAIDDYTTLINLKPNSSEYFDSRGWAHYLKSINESCYYLSFFKEL